MSKLPSDLAQQVATALAEDIGSGDITAELVPAAQRVTGKVITREDATLCGRPWVVEVFRQLDPSVQLKWHADDGDRVTANQTLFEIAGLARPVLTGERSALNFLQLLSATATATRGYVDAIAGTSAAILDTRKTVPGLRTAQKYAVLCGGGQNYRLGLFDQVLIKENHIAAAGSLTAAIEAARRAAGSRKVEVEVETPQEFVEALRAAPGPLSANFRVSLGSAAVIEPFDQVQIASARGRPLATRALLSFPKVFDHLPDPRSACLLPELSTPATG